MAAGERPQGLNVVMMGPPGAGKGTQAGRFAHERGLLKISTGDILRDAIKAQTPLGIRAKTTMDRGELVDDDTMIGIVRERLLRPDAQNGFVLDGFPRTVPQARALDEIVAARGAGPLVVVDIVVPMQELVRRLVGRRICSKCGANADPYGAAEACKRCGGLLVHRSDDTQEVVQERLRVYERQTFPLVEYYRKRPSFRVVNGAQPPGLVAAELDRAVDHAASVGAPVQTTRGVVQG